jgi:hypothetical protein
MDGELTDVEFWENMATVAQHMREQATRVQEYAARLEGIVRRELEAVSEDADEDRQAFVDDHPSSAQETSKGARRRPSLGASPLPSSF